MMRIAITGSIASGKSTLASYLKEKGYTVYDCDVINAELLKKGEDGYKAVVGAFAEILDENGAIDKKKLASTVFFDKEANIRLNSIMHPLIRKRLLALAETIDPFIIEVPLLFEVGWENLFDEVVTVVANEELTIDRLVSKGYSVREAKARLNLQMRPEDKIAMSNHVLYNDGDIDSFKKAIDAWIEEVLC